jgi:hypothetical protein
MPNEYWFEKLHNFNEFNLFNTPWSSLDLLEKVIGVCAGLEN